MPAKTSRKAGPASGGKTKKRKIKMEPKTPKKVSVKKAVRPKVTKKNFHVSYLALVIIGLLILEGLLFTFSSKAAWQEAVSILDMGPAAAQTVDDLEFTLAPVIETVFVVNEFYSMATDAAMELLDANGAEQDLLLVVNGITDFYILASVEMESLLEVSSLNIYSPQVAGMSIEN